MHMHEASSITPTPDNLTSRETSQECTDMEDFQISQIKWDEKGKIVYTEKPETEYSETQYIRFKDQTFKLRASREYYLAINEEDGSENKHELIYIYIYPEDYDSECYPTGKDKSEICLNINFDDSNSGNIEVDTSIEKIDERGRLPRQFGITLYHKIAPFIQERADSTNKTFIHEVFHEPEISDTPINLEKWHELFDPFLKENKYKQGELRDGHHYKKYVPSQSEQ